MLCEWVYQFERENSCALRLPSGVASPSLVNEKEFSSLPVTLVCIPSLWREKRKREKHDAIHMK